MPIRLEEPIVAAALVTGASAVAVAIVNGLFRTICTWMQNRSKKPPANKPRRVPARRPCGHIILWWWSSPLRWPVALLALLQGQHRRWHGAC